VLNVENRTAKISRLLKAYHDYLESSDTAQFVAGVARNYTNATLVTILDRCDILHRRAAALALGFLGDITCQESLGNALSSQDRRLRLVSDDSLRALWARDGSEEQRLMLDKIIRTNECDLFEEAVALCDQLLERAPKYVEAYNQRALALFHLRDFDRSINDCRQVLKLSRHHYGAWIGLGHCLLENGDVWGALDSFRMALSIYPDLEPVRLQIRTLERSLQE
jgi:tetratricopeptide (TPR) repeat protein